MGYIVDYPLLEQEPGPLLPGAQELSQEEAA